MRSSGGTAATRYSYSNSSLRQQGPHTLPVTTGTGSHNTALVAEWVLALHQVPANTLPCCSTKQSHQVLQACRCGKAATTQLCCKPRGVCQDCGIAIAAACLVVVQRQC